MVEGRACGTYHVERGQAKKEMAWHLPRMFGKAWANGDYI